MFKCLRFVWVFALLYDSMYVTSSFTWYVLSCKIIHDLLFHHLYYYYTIVMYSADVNAADNFLWTPLHHACHSGEVSEMYRADVFVQKCL